MATKEDQESLRLLAQHVIRSFYEAKHVVIMDQLVRHPVLKDDDLAGRIGLQAKELNKLMAVLTNDRLVQVHRQNELKDGATRSVGKQYYFIDYLNLCNVVKWRVTEMRRVIDSTLRNELDNKGYICPNCGATFSSLEADRLMDFSLGTFVCDQCTMSPGAPHEVVLNEDAENVRGSKDRMERFNRQTRFIREGLKKSESMVLPAFDVAAWIKVNTVDVPHMNGAATADGGELKIAGSGSGVKQEDGIGIVMSVDKDEATRREERAREAEAKRVQNAMPSWHLKSTISGDLTSLGVAAQTAAENAATNGITRVPGVDSNVSVSNSLNGARSNATILNGLGKIKLPARQSTDEVSLLSDVKPVIKPVVDKDEDYWDKYYASLEAASRDNTNQNTPMLDSADSDFEEDRKMGVKRPRDDGTLHVDENNRSKAVRSNSGTPIFSGNNSVGGGSSPGEFAVDAEATQDSALSDERTVLVGGVPIPFSGVTQEMADEKMTPEEYTAWYEMLMAE